MARNFGILSGAVSDRGLSEKRPQNEDSFLDMEKCGIFAVADGVGGAQAGEVASQMAMEILAEAFANIGEGEDSETVMNTAISRANTAIHQMALELPQLANMATTVVALHLNGNIATIGHVGDSRLYRVDPDGTFYRETDDHSVVAEEVRAGRMTEEQADNHPSRNIISRALGADSVVDVDIKTIMVKPGTAFLICSDGITRHVADAEIKGVLTFGGQPAEICEYLKGLCYERGAEDNLTAVVVKVSETGIGFEELLELSESEDQTVASARRDFVNNISDNDTDELLELETRDLSATNQVFRTDREESDEDDPVLLIAEVESITEPAPIENTEAQARIEETELPVRSEGYSDFSLFNESGSNPDVDERPSSFGRIAGSIGMLILGSAIGLGVYHFALLPPPVVLDVPNLAVMKSEDIAFSSFEKNRRNVDADPTAYLKELPPPEGAEDYYLIGRANILVGDFPKARLALIEAQKLVSSSEPMNSRILKTDIAAALVITQDPAIQTRFKTEIDAGSPALDNTNVNR